MNFDFSKLRTPWLPYCDATTQWMGGENVGVTRGYGGSCLGAGHGI